MPTTRLTLRLPSDLAEEATAQATAYGISLNAWLVLGVRNWVTYKRKEVASSLAGPQRITRDTPSPPRPPAPASTRLPVSKGATWPKVGRNDPCPCGSGRKWKVCHGKP